MRRIALLTFVTLGLAASPTLADLMPTVGGTLTGNPGDVLPLTIDVTGNVDSVISANFSVQLAPIGGAPAANVTAVSVGGFWAGSGVIRPNSAADPNVGIAPSPLPQSTVGFATSPTASTPVTAAAGTLFNLNVQIPPGASAGQMWNLLFFTDILDSNYNTRLPTGGTLAKPFDFSGLPAGPAGTVIGAKITAVPEPSAFLFLGLCAGGGLAVQCVRRRKAGRQQSNDEVPVQTEA